MTVVCGISEAINFKKREYMIIKMETDGKMICDECLFKRLIDIA